MRKTPSASQNTENETLISWKMRVYPKKKQEKLLNLWFYHIQKFRNHMVWFCENRRKIRAQWIRQHHFLAKTWVPEELSGDDVNAASKYLTKQLEFSREQVRLLWGTQGNRNTLAAEIIQKLKHLSFEEKAEIPHASWLMFPRTLLDQVLQDLSKTYRKALKDRKSKSGKIAGFPKFRKHSFPCSIRFQIPTTKNKTYVEAWKHNVVYLPMLGEVRWRNAHRTLPQIPPEMITVSRNAAGHYHITFLNKDATASSLRKNRALPMETVVIHGQEKQIPIIVGGDLGLKTQITLSNQKESQRQRHFKRYEKRLRKANQGLARKTHGSGRWIKAKRKLGQIHVKIANCREEGLRKEAQSMVKSAAIVCLENLNLAFMLKNRRLAKSASDASLGKFKALIQWEAQKAGHLVLECGRFDASTQICNVCKFKNTALTLKDREWTCGFCRTHHNRDHNAAVNIKEMALTRYLDEITSSGNDDRNLSKLHPQLRDFIARGELASLISSEIESRIDEASVLLKPTLNRGMETRIQG